MSYFVRDLSRELKKEPFILYRQEAFNEDIVKELKKVEERLKKDHELPAEIKANFKDLGGGHLAGLEGYEVKFNLLGFNGSCSNEETLRRYKMLRERTGKTFDELISTVARLDEEFPNLSFENDFRIPVKRWIGAKTDKPSIDSHVYVYQKTPLVVKKSGSITVRPKVQIMDKQESWTLFNFTLGGKVSIESMNFEDFPVYGKALDHVVYVIYRTNFSELDGKKTLTPGTEKGHGPGEHLVAEYAGRAEEAEIKEAPMSIIYQNPKTGPLVNTQMIKVIMDAKESIKYAGHMGIIHQRTWLDKADQNLDIKIVTTGDKSAHDEKKKREVMEMLKNLSEHDNVTVKLAPGFLLHGRYLSVDGRIAIGGSADLNADSQERVEYASRVIDRKVIEELDKNVFGYYWENSNFANWGKKKK